MPDLLCAETKDLPLILQDYCKTVDKMRISMRNKCLAVQKIISTRAAVELSKMTLEAKNTTIVKLLELASAEGSEDTQDADTSSLLDDSVVGKFNSIRVATAKMTASASARKASSRKGGSKTPSITSTVSRSTRKRGIDESSLALGSTIKKSRGRTMMQSTPMNTRTVPPPFTPRFNMSTPITEDFGRKIKQGELCVSKNGSPVMGERRTTNAPDFGHLHINFAGRNTLNVDIEGLELDEEHQRKLNELTTGLVNFLKVRQITD